LGIFYRGISVENIDRNSCSNLGRLVIKEGDSLSDPRSLRFFIVAHAVFSSVGTEMLAGGSVVAGWDQKERAGPKDDRQVTEVSSCLL
jgi:hypothetical protein